VLLKKIFRDRRETGQGSQEEPGVSAEIGNRQKTSESLQSSNRDIRQVHRVSGKIGGTISVETAARDSKGRLKSRIRTLLYPCCARIRYEKPIFTAVEFAASPIFREDWNFPYILGKLPVLRVFAGLKALVFGLFSVCNGWSDSHPQPCIAATEP
jgi:hypothetical protein